MIFIIWLFLCVLVGIFANSKGRSGFGFFLLSVLLSPLLGFIIALIVKEGKVAKDSSGFRKCPKCAEEIKIQAKICKHCGNEDLPIIKNPDLTDRHISDIQKILDKGVDYNELSEKVLGENIPIESLTPYQASMIIQNG